MGRCYDAGRMRIIGGLGRTIVWVVVAAALALGSAGLVGELSHPPGGESRAELTWAADQDLDTRLDDATNDLRSIEKQVDQLAAEARDALEAVAGADASQIQAALDKGSKTAVVITSE